MKVLLYEPVISSSDHHLTRSVYANDSPKKSSIIYTFICINSCTSTRNHYNGRQQQREMVMEDLQQLVQTVTARIEQFDARSAAARAARDARIRENVENNHGIEPTVSAAGMHAPCDNYYWEWYLSDRDGVVEKEFDGVFMAGEFLPWSKQIKLFCSDYADKRTGSPLRRVTYITPERADAVIEALSGIVDIHTGKPFEDRDGDRMVYVYIDERCKDVADAIQSYLEAPKVAAAAAQRAAEQAELDAAEPCPTGRVEITGEILTIKLQEGYYGDTWKMLVKDDRGFKVWGSIPSSLHASRGVRVSFMAAVEPSADDDKFGFFKRPTKAVNLDEEAA